MPDSLRCCDVWQERRCHRRISSSPRSNRIAWDRSRPSQLVPIRFGLKRRRDGNLNYATKGTKQNKMNRKTSILVTLLISLAVFCPTAIAQEEFKPITVFVVRHAEKEAEPKQDPPLTKEGVARSQELARVLGGANIKAIYTSQFARTKLTAGPLVAKTGLAVTPFTLKPNPENLRLIAEESTME